MSGYSFWCSSCKKSHPGECEPKRDAFTQYVNTHDWVKQQVIYDLNMAYQCSKCGRTTRFSLVQVMLSEVDGVPLPFPFESCPVVRK